MAGSLTDTLKEDLLNHVFGGNNYVRLATVYVALFTTVPTDDGGGVECGGGDYARVAVPNDIENWPLATTIEEFPTKKNGTLINFPTATAPWGTVCGAAIMSAATGGSMLMWASVPERLVGINDTVVFAVDTITIRMN